MPVFADDAGKKDADKKEASSSEAALPEPTDVILQTKDEVLLAATYFPGTHKKDTLPVILVHPLGGNRHQWGTFAQYLQKTFGWAVIVPDLRGHGDSTVRKDQSKISGGASLPLAQLPLIVRQDMEAVKKFLLEENNKETLNIDKLTVVGAQSGATIAMLWSAVDWSWPVLATGRQGQDVKAVVLVSPEYAYKTLTLHDLTAPANRDVCTKVAIDIAFGSGDSKATKEADRIYKFFKPLHRAKTGDDQDLFYVDSLKTKLEGINLIDEESLKLSEQIGNFVHKCVGTQPSIWQKR